MVSGWSTLLLLVYFNCHYSTICKFKVSCMSMMKRHILVCHEIRCPYCATKLISTAATICTHLSNHHQFESSAAEEEAKRMVFLDVYPFFVCFYFQLQTLNKRRLTVMAEKENMETEQPAVDFNERFAGIHLVYRHHWCHISNDSNCSKFIWVAIK